MARLELVTDTNTFWVRPPPGERLDLILAEFYGKKREALERLLSQRFPLSEMLRKRINHYESSNSGCCFFVQCCCGLLLPPLQQRTWDYDRDMGVLRQEASAMLSSFFLPSEYDLQEHIQSEGSFREGKVLFLLYFT